VPLFVLVYFGLFYLPPEAQFNSKNGMVNKSKPRLTMNGKSVTIRAGILVEHDLIGKPVTTFPDHAQMPR
jgi:hypothetical protein